MHALALLSLFQLMLLVYTIEVDPLGYIAYCPCMGKSYNETTLKPC